MSLDESYYWTWAKNLQLSYFDHPPFISWLFYIAQPFDNFFQAVRWPAVILAHSTLIIWFYLLKDVLSKAQLNWFFLLAILSPLTGPGSLILTPDLPLIFFWSLGILAFKRALKSSSVLDYSILGAVLGLGFCSKYHTALFLPFALVYMFIDKKLTIKNLVKLLPGLFLFFIFSSPVWIWNYNNDFISFKFQLNHGLGKKTWDYSWTLKYVLGQILLIFPPLFLIFIKSKNHFKELKLIYFFSWVVLGFFFLTSFKGHVEANWTAIAYLPILAIVAANYKNSMFLKVTTVFWGLLFVFVVSEMTSPLVTKNFPKLKTNEFTKFDALITSLNKRELKSPLFGRTYQMSSKLSFELKKPIYKLKGLNRIDYYDFLKKPYPKELSEFYVILKPNEMAPQWIIDDNFTFIKTEPLTPNYNLVHFKK